MSVSLCVGTEGCEFEPWYMLQPACCALGKGTLSVNLSLPGSKRGGGAITIRGMSRLTIKVLKHFICANLVGCKIPSFRSPHGSDDLQHTGDDTNGMRPSLSNDGKIFCFLFVFCFCEIISPHSLTGGIHPMYKHCSFLGVQLTYAQHYLQIHII